MLYNLQMERREKLSEREELVKQVEDLRVQAEEQASAAASGSKPKVEHESPCNTLGATAERAHTRILAADLDRHPSSSETRRQRIPDVHSSSRFRR
jgi:hypothetical protein